MSSSAASLRSGLTIALGRAARLAARLRRLRKTTPLNTSQAYQTRNSG